MKPVDVCGCGLEPDTAKAGASSRTPKVLAAEFSERAQSVSVGDWWRGDIEAGGNLGQAFAQGVAYF